MLYVLLIALLLVGCANDEKDTLPEEEELDKTITLRPEIDIMIGFDKGGARASRDKHCWEEKDKECSLEPTLPSEFLDSYIVNPIKPGDDILFQFAVPGNDFDFPEPDSFIAYVQEDDEMKPIEVNNNTIQAPLTPGKYYMSVKAIWDSELKGETIYAFSLMVKE